MPPLAIVAIAIPLVVSLIAIAFELRTGEIPNTLTLGAFSIAWPLAFFAGTLPQAVAGFFLAFVVGLMAYRRGFVGGGALKLAAAIGALTSWHTSAAIIIVSVLVVLVTWQRAKRLLAQDPLADPPLPPGSPFIALGTVVGLAGSWLGR